MKAPPSTLLVRVSLVLFAAAVLGACASQPPAPLASTPGERATPGARAAAIAVDQVGVPYRYGGSGPGGFDCSGLVHYAYQRVGVSVPRTTQALWKKTRPVTNNEVQPGDLLFFSFEGKMSHVGMYIGDQRFVHAPSSGKTVSIATLRADYYRRALVRAARPH